MNPRKASRCNYIPTRSPLRLYANAMGVSRGRMGMGRMKDEYIR
jgi:hypothetical protein